MRGIDLGEPAFAARHDHAGQGEPAPARGHLDRQDRPVFPIGQQRGVGERAGRDQSHHLSFDRSLRSGRIAELLADCDRLAHLHQPGQVLLGGMKGHARHPDRLAIGGAASGQRDAKQPGCLVGIVVKELIEIAHAIKEQHRRVLGLDAKVLLHHGRVAGKRLSGRRGGMTLCRHRWPDRSQAGKCCPVVSVRSRAIRAQAKAGQAAFAPSRIA